MLLVGKPHFKSEGHMKIFKKMKKGFIFNKKHFHASSSAISCILWQNINECLEEIKEKEVNEELEIQLEIEEIITKIKDYFFEKQIY